MAEQPTFEAAVAAVRDGGQPEEQARELYGQLSPEERLWLLDGDEEFWVGLEEMIAHSVVVPPGWREEKKKGKS